MGLDTANAKEYAAVVTKGLFGNILSNAIPIAIAANILCNDIVHKFLHASALVPDRYDHLFVIVSLNKFSYNYVPASFKYIS